MKQRPKRRISFEAAERRDTKCFESEDTSRFSISSEFLLKSRAARDPSSQQALLCEQFLKINRHIFSLFNVSCSFEYTGRDVLLVFDTKTMIGSMPLLSPTTGRVDYGLVIKPRFQWDGLGPMLHYMGWRVIPKPLNLPIVPGTERKIPGWVLSTIILHRIEALLKQSSRKFELFEKDLSAPKGKINWGSYATSKIPRVKFLQVPCRFSDITQNNEMKSAVHYVLKKQLGDLETQKQHGIMVSKLIELCQILITKVDDISPRQPLPRQLEAWRRMPLKGQDYSDGIQAMEWVVDERGLAGLSNLDGLPWAMSMEEFFEAWIETMAEKIARRIGGTTKAGRKRQTITPISWDPPYTGSQKYLLPDIILEKEDETIIFDSKYKRHFEEISFERWSNLGDDIKQSHRDDILQVLAYSSVCDKNVTSCLIYPCRYTTWESLRTRGRLSHVAHLHAGAKKIRLVLTAVPMENLSGDIMEPLVSLFNGKWKE